MPAKLGMTAEQRQAMLRNQASELLWYGKITTTKARAKALQPYVEKIITKAVKVYDDNVETQTKKADKKGKEVTVKSIKDSPKKLAARRAIMAKLRDLQEVKAFSEKKSDFKMRTADILDVLKYWVLEYPYGKAFQRNRAQIRTACRRTRSGRRIHARISARLAPRRRRGRSYNRACLTQTEMRR